MPSWRKDILERVKKHFFDPGQPPPEKRSVGISDTNGMLRLLGLSADGVNVTETTALGISALWCGVDLWCSVYATMPQKLYSKKDGIVKEEVNHPASILINRMPVDEYVPFDFKYSMRYNAIMRGGGGAEIIRDSNGNPVSLRLMRQGCTPYKLHKNDPLKYYDNEDGQLYDPSEVYFLPGIMVRDGAKAMPLLNAFYKQFGRTLQTDKMTDQFLKLGPLIGGVYTYTGKMSDLQKQSITKTLGEQYGGVGNAAKVLPLGSAESFKQFQPVNFAQSQMVEMKGFSISDVARMLRMPESLLQSLVKPSYNSLEQLFKQWKVTALDPAFTRADQESNRKLLRGSQMGEYYFETDVDEMLWMTGQERAEYWKALASIGGITPNEVRQYLNKNKVPGGDEPFVQMQMIPLSMAAQGATIKGDNQSKKSGNEN